jgi:hypothetical protein
MLKCFRFKLLSPSGAGLASLLVRNSFGAGSNAELFEDMTHVHFGRGIGDE